MSRLVRFVRRPQLRGVAGGLGCAVVAALLASTTFARGLDDWLFDGCFVARDQLRGPRPTGNSVVVIGIDEDDFDSFAKPVVFISPEIGEVVRHARRSGATAVGVDLMIPHSLSDNKVIVNSPLGKAADLGKAVRDAGHVTLAVSFPEGRPARWPVEQWLMYKKLDPDPRGRDVGSIDLVDDGDRFVRRAGVVVPGPGPEPGSENVLYPSLPLALVAWAGDTDYQWNPDTATVTLGGEAIPLGSDQKMRINWVGPPGTFRAVSFRHVLAAAREGKPVPELAGKIVVLGATARDVQDYHPTPYANRYAQLGGVDHGQLMSGVEIHANTVATLADRAFITTPGWLHPWPWLAAAGAGLGWLLARVGLGYGAVLVLGHHFAWKLLAIAALAYGNSQVDMIGMLALGGLVYAAAFALRWRVLRRVLAAVKSQALARALEDDPGRLDLAGENRVVTVMFVDVRAFSTFSRGCADQPQKVVALLNAYFTAAVPAVEAEGGTVNQFMGDGMMVLFNAPLDHLDHAARAVRAARGLVRAVRARAAEFAALGMPGLRVGVGVNTGACTVGAVGAPSRLDYTAIGDVTNAAARLEAATKDAGADILIGAETCRLLPAEARAGLGVRPDGRVMTLKGVGTIEVFVVDAG